MYFIVSSITTRVNTIPLTQTVASAVASENKYTRVDVVVFPMYTAMTNKFPNKPNISVTKMNKLGMYIFAVVVVS